MALEINTRDDGRIEFYGLFEDLQMGPLLLWILEEEQQGELTITANGIQQTIYFADGYPVGTRGGPADNFLGWLLREKGDIDDATYLTSLQRMAEEQQLQGQILLQMGAISESQLQDALLLQLRRKLIRLFQPTEGEFYFISAEELPIFDVAIGTLNPYTLTSHAIRQVFSHDRLTHCLSALEGYVFRLDEDSEWKQRVRDLMLEDDEIAALSLLENWNNVNHFIEQGYLDPTPAQVMIALLFSTNLLELDDEEDHPNLEYTVDPSTLQFAQRRTQNTHYEATEEDVSIRVETAVRPGKAPDPNAPRKRASVTVHLKEDRIETHSEIPRVGTTSSSSPHRAQPGVMTFQREQTPSETGEFIPPQDDEVGTDPAVEAVQSTAAAAVIQSPPAAVMVSPPPQHAPPRAAVMQSAPPTSRPEEPEPPASKGDLSPEEAEQKASIEAKLASVQSNRSTYYDILEIDPKADGNEVRKAYYAQSRTYHPDRVAGTPLEPLKSDLDIIFSFLNEAYSTLSNQEEREEYDAKLLDPEAAALEERAPKAAQAEVFFSKANVFIKKKDFAKAEEELQWACKLLEDEGDYQVALAWAIYNNPTRTTEDKRSKALFHLQNANDLDNADPEKLFWYWGSILKQEGDNKGALEQFQRLLKKKPRHTDAQREVRNLNAVLRREKESEKDDKSGKKSSLWGFLKK